MTRRFKTVVAYDGTHYAGWQVQPDQTTIQSELERVIREITAEEARVHCSGRTDAGVHAKAQVAHFDLESSIPGHKLQQGMNALLQSDIRVMSLAKTSAEFHARYDAKGKEYRYFIWNGPVLPPYERLYKYHWRRKLDVPAMQTASALLVGEHDFAAFSANPNREMDGTVRHLTDLTVRRRGHDITIVANGNGFLYKMVRSLAGFLIRVGNGEVPPEMATEILESGIRTARVPTAPPEGLFLWKVRY